MAKQEVEDLRGLINYLTAMYSEIHNAPLTAFSFSDPITIGSTIQSNPIRRMANQFLDNTGHGLIIRFLPYKTPVIQRYGSTALDNPNKKD
jgi:hypothetical protein